MAELATERVYLRPLSAQDATQTYADWMNDPQVNQYLETRHSPQSVESCRAFIEQCNADPASHLFGIFLQQGHRHVGNVKLGFVNSHYQRGQVSLFIGDKACWGQGLSSEVVRLITAYGFDSLGLHRLEAGCYEDNLASLRIFLKRSCRLPDFL